MNILRNPIVTGILAVAAAGVVFYQFGGAKLFRGRKPAPSPAAAAVSPNPKTQKPQVKSVAAVSARGGRTQLKKEPMSPASPTLVPQPERPVDAKLVEASFATWVKTPARDPFYMPQPKLPEAPAIVVETNSPVRTWKLGAIWNQTGSQLAVINNRVYRVGDAVVEGYKLTRIDKDEVWFQGPVRTERLGFEAPEKRGAVTNRASAKKTSAKKK